MKIGGNLAIGSTIMDVLLWYGKDLIEVTESVLS